MTQTEKPSHFTLTEDEVKAKFPTRLRGYDLFRAMGSPKHIVAPMVDQSELAWRMLSRRYNADLCYTPMFHAKMFSDPKSSKYRDEQWQTNETDKPVIVQFCANEPDALLAAAKLVVGEADAVDLNLGCPQHIAKRGHYGSFLMEDWDLVSSLIRKLHENLEIPVTAKIRVFPEVEKTVAYAKMAEAAGAQIICVHGRLREQK
ncbi:tRNA-dihydrouridine(16/17) synthase [NAD(P)(+)]-like protein, partial [Linderina macrospora]